MNPRLTSRFGFRAGQSHGSFAIGITARTIDKEERDGDVDVLCAANGRLFQRCHDKAVSSTHSPKQQGVGCAYHANRSSWAGHALGNHKRYGIP